MYMYIKMPFCYNFQQDDDFVKIIPSGLEKGDVMVFRGFMKPGGDT